jgi:hypothetical protein
VANPMSVATVTLPTSSSPGAAIATRALTLAHGLA